ncbi:MAG: HD domain-containing phosphohydrolase, partial [Halopseudomonas sp.]
MALSVYDATDTLLLKKGQIVASEHQKERLLNQKVFISLVEESSKTEAKKRREDHRPEKNAATISVFEWVEAHYQLISDVYHHFDDPGAQSCKKVQVLAERILRFSEKHSDGLLAAVQLATDKVYSHIKALHVGLLCEALGHRAGLSSSQRLSLIAAGLTHDLGMWQMQEKLRTRQEPLTDEQWTHIRSHPQRGTQLLQKAGVLNAVWLQTIEQHHERLNGSGYPKGLAGDKICQTARIVAVADTFAAMVRTRGDRDQRMPKDAMRDLFMSRGEEIDGMLAQLFIKELGLFPPGSSVRLVTGEIGIVTGAGNNASSPDVEVVVDAQGRPL